MKNSVKKELASHVIDKIIDGILTDDNKDEWHFYAFNEDYYIIGYFESGEWLKNHNIGEFEAAVICQQYELDNFGETTIYSNAETVVNMLAYIYGEELIYSTDAKNTEELKNEMYEIINN